MTKRIGVATAAYLALMSLLVISPLAEVGGVVTVPPLGIAVAATLLVAHVGFGAATRSFWSCAVCLVLPIVPLVLAPWVPPDSDIPDYPAALAFGGVFMAPWLVGLIATGVALGRRLSR
jgi:hypothetical protein